MEWTFEPNDLHRHRIRVESPFQRKSRGRPRYITMSPPSSIAFRGWIQSSAFGKTVENTGNFRRHHIRKVGHIRSLNENFLTETRDRKFPKWKLSILETYWKLSETFQGQSWRLGNFLWTEKVSKILNWYIVLLLIIRYINILLYSWLVTRDLAIGNAKRSILTYCIWQ